MRYARNCTGYNYKGDFSDWTSSSLKSGTGESLVRLITLLPEPSALPGRYRQKAERLYINDATLGDMSVTERCLKRKAPFIRVLVLV